MESEGLSFRYSHGLRPKALPGDSVGRVLENTLKPKNFLSWESVTAGKTVKTARNILSEH
jgi:hypothetical protein